VVCGSHKSTAPTPPAVRSGCADAALASLGLLQRPTLRAGDVLVISTGALSRPCATAGGVLTLDFISRRAQLSSGGAAADPVRDDAYPALPPDSWLSELSEVE
jgi:hypothetical protein